MHKIGGIPSQIAEDCGFLAEVALQLSEWEKAGELAKLILSILEQSEAEKKETGLYLLLLAKAQRNLNQQLDAVRNLETAKENTEPQDDVQLYLRILEDLRSLYFDRGEYLKAFRIKLEQQEVKSKYRLQAFIGASRLQSPQQIIDSGLESGKSKAEIVGEIEAASGRSRDIKEISQRLRTPAGKLTIVHGQSGVGKSSIIQSWLVSALQLTTIEARDILPVLLQSYHDWARDCGQFLQAGIEQLKAENFSTPIDTPSLWN
ncbi:MAG: hypothetical protein MUE44_05035 [Oscillatoriaceae cyanobacterium Prado104]|nr:hypothetical protein [Oscillatoriaceae cyanobacterium Prado104]